MEDVVVVAKQYVKISGNIMRWWDVGKLEEQVGVQYIYLTNADTQEILLYINGRRNRDINILFKVTKITNIWTKFRGKEEKENEGIKAGN